MKKVYPTLGFRLRIRFSTPQTEKADAETLPNRNRTICSKLQMTEDFREFFSSRAAAAAGPKGVRLDGFRGYYREVGVCEPYDSVFVRMIEVRYSSWECN